MSYVEPKSFEGAVVVTIKKAVKVFTNIISDLPKSTSVIINNTDEGHLPSTIREAFFTKDNKPDIPQLDFLKMLSFSYRLLDNNGLELIDERRDIKVNYNPK